MNNNQNCAINNIRFNITNIIKRFSGLFISLCSAADSHCITAKPRKERTADRGFKPAGSYALTDIETSACTSGKSDAAYA